MNAFKDHIPQRSPSKPFGIRVYFYDVTDVFNF